MVTLRVVAVAELGDGEDARRLRESLRSVVGEGTVKAIKAHPRGGYAVAFEAVGVRIDAVAARLEESGWRVVV